MAPLIHRFVDIYRLGVLRLNHVQYFCEVPYRRLIIVGRRCGCPHVRAVNAAQNGRYEQYGYD